MFTKKTLGVLSTAFAGALSTSAIGAEATPAPSSYKVEFSPRIEATGAHTDNVLKAPNGVKDSTLALALIANLNMSKPDQIISSDLGISTTEHRKYSNEEDDAYYFSANLLQHASKNWSFNMAARVEDSVLARGALTEEDADHRTKTKTYNASVGAAYETDEYKYSLALQHAQFDLQDNTKLGAILNKDDEDRGETNLVLHGVYKLSAAFQPSFTASYGQINYAQTLDDYGNNRSSDVTKLLLGANYKITPHASINGDVGYYWRDYAGVSFDSIKVVIGNVMLKAQASENLMGFAGVSRSFNELNIADSPGLIVENYSAGLMYKLTKKISVKGTTGKVHSEAQLVGIVAKDYVNSIGCSYAFNERYSALLQYTHTKRLTNSQMILPFTEDAVALKLTASF